MDKPSINVLPIADKHLDTHVCSEGRPCQNLCVKALYLKIQQQQQNLVLKFMKIFIHKYKYIAMN